MAKFYQQIKTIFTDIEKFLVVSIKDSKISKAAVIQKTSILEQISQLKVDYPQLDSGDDSSAKPDTPAQPKQEPEEGEDLYEETDTVQAVLAADNEELCKKEISASDGSQVTISGQLKSRKDKKGTILSKLAKKQYCVLRGKLFYIYDKKTSKKQTDCFCLDGYEVTSLEDETKKDYAFELTCEEKKTYIFEAASQDELQSWMTNLRNATGHLGARTETVTSADEDEDLYEDTDAMAAAMRSGNLPSASESPPPLPSAASRAPAPVPVPAQSSRPPPALPARTLPVPTPEDGEDLYEEGDVFRSPDPTSGSPSGESLPKSPVDEPQDIYDDTVPDMPTSPRPLSSDGQDIYDETTCTAANPPLNKSSLFSPSLQAQSIQLDGCSPRSSFRRPAPPPKKALPPPPGQHNGSAPADPQYDSMYYGVWDCTTEQEKELPFRRGDIITVLDKQYEDRGWWVGELNNKVGLVPKSFLSQAYERA